MMMMDDERFTHYLTDRADTITLPPAGPTAVMNRATVRRRRRRVMVAGSLLAVAATGTAAIMAGGPDGENVEIGPAAPTGATLDWTLVEPEIGLGYSQSAVTIDRTIYSLSTAPGPITDTYDSQKRLYQSTDGEEWSEVALPDDLWASSLAASGSRLYAVGTAPAGGGAEVVIASSDDAGASWSSLSSLPLDLAAVQEASGAERLTVGGVTVAAGPSGVVAAAVVHGQPDIEELLGQPIPDEAGYSLTPEGVEVYAPEVCEDEGCAEPTILVQRSWDDIGASPELRSLIDGELHVFFSPDGTTFEPVSLDATTALAPMVVASDAGFHLIAQESGRSGVSQVHALHSTDGRNWNADPLDDAAGYAVSLGILNGRAAMAVASPEPGGPTALRVRASDGSWSALDLVGAVAAAVQAELSWVHDVAFGPLGAAAIVASEGGDGPGEQYLVYSADGATYSVEPLSEHLDDESLSVTGVSVTADAVLVRVSNPADEDPETPPSQRLLVGTPR